LVELLAGNFINKKHAGGEKVNKQFRSNFVTSWVYECNVVLYSH